MVGRSSSPPCRTAARQNGRVGWALLDTLDEADRREVLSACRRRKFDRGEVVFHEGDPGDTLHLIAKGHVAVRTTTPRGDQALIRVLGAGDFFGELAVIAPAPRNATIACLDSTETLGLHREAFDELRAKNPGVNAVLMQALIAEVRRLSAQLSEALYLPAESRVWKRVTDLARLYTTAANNVVTIPLTQDDVAHMAGTTRPTANQVLRSGEVNGVLRISRGRIDILDVAALEKLAR
jgi:CRP/FNR family transcriptional regulator, cyclic AMP receptor protein